MKKIFLFIFFGILIGIGWNMRSSFLTPTQQSKQSVKGAHTSTNYIPNLSTIQQDINKLPFAEVASSSPQVQKILQELQKYPKTEAKTICENICKNIK